MSVASWRGAVRLLKLRFDATPLRDRIYCAVVVLALYVSSGMLFFGMNFWLHSFHLGSNTFVSMMLPAVAWAVMFGLPLYLYRCRLPYRQAASPVGAGYPPPGSEALTVNVARESVQLIPQPTRCAHPLWGLRCIGLLCCLGLVDSLGGLTSVYSTAHVPVLVQALLIAGSPLYTYLFSRVFFATSLRPVTPTLAASVFFLLCGIALSLYPQIASSQQSLYVSAKWLIIFFLGAVLPNLYNVVQGRFLDDYSDKFRTPMECKLVALAGDTFTQVFFTAAYFPLDSVPHFGSADSFGGTWEGFTDGAHCIFFACSNNFVYFCLYVVGLWMNRISYTYLNAYSPTVGAVLGQLTQPVNTCLLLMFPSLNVFGEPGSWWCTLLCFVLMTLSMLLLIAWHEAPEAAHVDVTFEKGRPMDSSPTSAIGSESSPSYQANMAD